MPSEAFDVHHLTVVDDSQMNSLPSRHEDIFEEWQRGLPQASAVGDELTEFEEP